MEIEENEFRYLLAKDKIGTRDFSNLYSYCHEDKGNPQRLLRRVKKNIHYHATLIAQEILAYEKHPNELLRKNRDYISKISTSWARDLLMTLKYKKLYNPETSIEEVGKETLEQFNNTCNSLAMDYFNRIFHHITIQNRTNEKRDWRCRRKSNKSEESLQDLMDKCEKLEDTFHRSRRTKKTFKDLQKARAALIRHKKTKAYISERKLRNLESTLA